MDKDAGYEGMWRDLKAEVIKLRDTEEESIEKIKMYRQFLYMMSEWESEYGVY